MGNAVLWSPGPMDGDGWAANEQEKLTLSCGVASDMHAAKRICQNWWRKSVRSLRGSVVAVCEGRLGDNGHLYWKFDGRAAGRRIRCGAPEHFEQGAMWIIAVCDDGTFTVNETDEILLTLQRHDACFATLAEAKVWCQTQEGQM